MLLGCVCGGWLALGCNGDLRWRLLPLLSPAQRAMLRTAAEIAVGVAFMHSLDVVHGGALAAHPRPPPPSFAHAIEMSLPLVGRWIPLRIA